MPANFEAIAVAKKTDAAVADAAAAAAADAAEQLLLLNASQLLQNATALVLKQTQDWLVQVGPGRF